MAARGVALGPSQSFPQRGAWGVDSASTREQTNPSCPLRFIFYTVLALKVNKRVFSSLIGLKMLLLWSFLVV